MQGAVIFKTASEVACKVGFDTKTGLHLLSSNSSNPATNQPGPSTDEKPSCKDKLQAPGSRGQFKQYSFWLTHNFC